MKNIKNEEISLIRVLFLPAQGYGDETAKKNFIEYALHQYPNAKFELVVSSDLRLDEKIEHLFSLLFLEYSDRFIRISLSDLGKNPGKYETADFCVNVSANNLHDVQPKNYNSNEDLAVAIVRNWADTTKSKVYACLSPHQTGERFSDQLILIQRMGEYKPELLELDVESSVFFHPSGSLEQAAKFLTMPKGKLLIEKKPVIQELIDLKQKNMIYTQLIYGLREEFSQVMDKLQNIIETAITAIKHYRHEKRSALPHVIILANEWSDKNKKKMIQTVEKNHAIFIDATQKKLKEYINYVKNGIFVIHLGSLPDNVFLALAHTGDLPTWAEGANLESSLKNAGLPFVHVEQGCKLLSQTNIPIPLHIALPEILSVALSALVTQCKGSSPQIGELLFEYYKITDNKDSYFMKYWKQQVELHHNKQNRFDILADVIKKSLEKPFISENDYRLLSQAVEYGELSIFKELIVSINPFYSLSSEHFSPVAKALIEGKGEFVIAAMQHYPESDTAIPQKWIKSLGELISLSISRRMFFGNDGKTFNDLEPVYSGFFRAISPAVQLIIEGKHTECGKSAQKFTSYHRILENQGYPTDDYTRGFQRAHPLIVASLLRLHQLKGMIEDFDVDELNDTIFYYQSILYRLYDLAIRNPVIFENKLYPLSLSDVSFREENQLIVPEGKKITRNQDKSIYLSKTEDELSLESELDTPYQEGQEELVKFCLKGKLTFSAETIKGIAYLSTSEVYRDVIDKMINHKRISVENLSHEEVLVALKINPEQILVRALENKSSSVARYLLSFESFEVYIEKLQPSLAEKAKGLLKERLTLVLTNPILEQAMPSVTGGELTHKPSTRQGGGFSQFEYSFFKLANKPHIDAPLDKSCSGEITEICRMEEGLSVTLVHDCGENSLQINTEIQETMGTIQVLHPVTGQKWATEIPLEQIPLCEQPLEKDWNIYGTGTSFLAGLISGILRETTSPMVARVLSSALRYFMYGDISFVAADLAIHVLPESRLTQLAQCGLIGYNAYQDPTSIVRFGTYQMGYYGSQWVMKGLNEKKAHEPFLVSSYKTVQNILFQVLQMLGAMLIFMMFGKIMCCFEESSLLTPNQLPMGLDRH